MSIKYQVSIPSNHNDTIETYDSFEAAKQAAKNGYGDVEVVLCLVQNNQQLDISEELQTLKDLYVTN